MHVAEVVQSSLGLWSMLSIEMTNYPGLGSLVLIPQESNVLYGLICGVEVAPTDTLYVPIPLGLTPTELDRLHPQSRVHTRVTLTAVTIGFQTGGIIYYQWPDRPPALHGLVYAGTTQDYQQFFIAEHYIPVLMYHQIITAVRDELLLALLTRRYRLGVLQKEQLQQFVRAIAPFYLADYTRFRQILQRIERICSQDAAHDATNMV